LNLPRFIALPLSEAAHLDESELADTVQVAVRFLNDVIDVSKYPLRQQRAESLAKRRIELGITGLADALAMHGRIYGIPEAAELASRWAAVVEYNAYAASICLAEKRGAFPLFFAARFGESGHAARLHPELHNRIVQQGIQNGLPTSIAPTGTISLLVWNASSGIEPIFRTHYSRKVLQADGTSRKEVVTDYAAAPSASKG
jgi:ribonucleoside-diphosphate reductase alpha chain